MDPERKSLVQVEIKDAEKGIVTARIASFNEKDYDNDLTLPGAFGDQNVRVSAYEHGSWMGALPVGKGTIREDDKGAIAELKFFMSTPHGRDHFATVKEMGDLQEWSYGFDVKETGEITEEMRQSGVERVLKKLKVHEVSPVMLGAGVGTHTMAVKGEKEKGGEKPVDEPKIGEFGRLLEALRKERDLSNLEIGQAMDVPAAGVDAYLEGRRPRLRQIEGLAELTKSSVSRIRAAAEEDGHDYSDEDEMRSRALAAENAHKAALRQLELADSALAEAKSAIEAKTAQEAAEAAERADAFQREAKAEIDRFQLNMDRYR